MGNSFLKPDPVKHWTDDPKSQWQYILFMQSPLDQMAKTHMEIDARTAYAYEAITVTEASTQNLVDAGIQYLASYKDDAGKWLDGGKAYELVVPKDVPMLNFWSVVLYDNDTRCMIVNPQGKTEVNSRQALVKNGDGSVRLVFSPQKPTASPRPTGSRPTRKRASSPTSLLLAHQSLLRPLLEDGEHRRGEVARWPRISSGWRTATAAPTRPSTKYRTRRGASSC